MNKFNYTKPRAIALISITLFVLVLVAGLVGNPIGAREGTIRTYYIAADEVRWDYAPSYPGINPMTNEAYSEGLEVFLNQGADRIGDTYIKAQYREYTDGSFTTLKPIPQEWQHLGILGPVIRAEVGDTIVIHFQNNTGFPTSMHPHGVFYDKDSEGNMYQDGTSENPALNDGYVPQGGSWTYTWTVPNRAGPGPNDPNSIVWAYHGHVDEPGDTNAWMIGPIIVTAKGQAERDGSPKGVDREFVTLFTVFDENRSIYLDTNIAEFTGGVADTADEGFIESNLMHSINGFVEGDLPGLNMKMGEHVRWYLIGMGTEVDLHTAHWHGNVVLDAGQRSDVIFLGPLVTKTVDMIPDNPGTWMYHCHVNDHIEAGMMAMYTVTP